MLTLVTAYRRQIFGDIQNGVMTLSPFGIVARDFWLKTPGIQPGVRLDEFIVMPDHLHAIIWIADEHGIFGYSKYLTAFSHDVRNFGPLDPKSLATVVGAYKSAVTRFIRVSTGSTHFKVWQRNYHELIIRSPIHLLKYQRYIRENPKNWNG
jgi:REP element-mobilizing transposase RayT